MRQACRVVLVLFASVLAPLAASGRQVDCRQNPGPYTIDGRVVMRTAAIPALLEVRLERDGGVWVESAFADGNGEFTFSGLALDNSGSTRWYLVVEREDFITARHAFNWTEIACNYGGLVLYLDPVPPAPPADAGTGPRTVGVQQLLAEIPAEAIEAYEEAMAGLEAGDTESAVAHLESAIALAPDYYEALNKLGVEYLKAGRFRDAEARLDRATALNPSDPRPVGHLGTLHYQEGRAQELRGDAFAAQVSYAEAITLFEHAIRLGPLVGEPYFYLGLASYATGDFPTAEAALLEALDLDGRLSEAHLTLLNVYTRQERYAEALDQIASFLEVSPDSPHRGAVEAIRIQIESTQAAR